MLSGFSLGVDRRYAGSPGACGTARVGNVAGIRVGARMIDHGRPHGIEFNITHAGQ